MSSYSYITGLMEETLRDTQSVRVKGKVNQIIGTMIKATLPEVHIGELVTLANPGSSHKVHAEVVGFSEGQALLTPLGDLEGISSDAEVNPTGESHRVAVGPGLLGRVLDGLGRPLDGRPLETDTTYPVSSPPPDPMQRRIIEKPLSLGLRSLDGLLTCGEGQRMGIFAAAGGGKSTLLSMLVRQADVDVTVLALIGERGREVREFLTRDLGEAGLAKSVVVVSTSDRPSMERLKAAHVATAISEYFRDQGKRVLLLMDSVTRFARAQREIGLAAGEPPTRRGFPPSVFTALPKLMERAGNSDKGSITALYTVLVEGDDMTEPIADETRSILDGHIILSRKLAESGHYPAIDILASVSRVMNAVVSPRQREAAMRFRSLLAKYSELEMLVQVGEYRRGGDALGDEALDKIAQLNAFLKQGQHEASDFNQTLDGLVRLAGI